MPPLKSLFDPALAADLAARLATLRADSPRQWGTMTPPQMLAHCARGLQMAVGELRPPRAFIGRVLGGIVKPKVLGDDAPLRRNSPTARELVVAEPEALDAERARLVALIERFVEAGPAGCTTHPHAFFGRMRPDEWGVLMYKHLDHHLRQFGV